MSKAISFVLNEAEVTSRQSPGMVTLDFIRKQRGLCAAKEGCREGECGACTVLLGDPKRGGLEYKAAASCMLPLGELVGKHLVTNEGLNQDGLTPIQQAVLDEGASQCGFCTPGIIVSLTGFFLNSPHLDYEDALDALDGNICRCTGYVSIKRAVNALCRRYKGLLESRKERIGQLIDWHILPAYFKDIPARLRKLARGKEEEAEKSAGGPVVVAGATDLYIQKPDELLERPLRFIAQRKELEEIKEENGFVYLGAAAAIEQVKNAALMRKIIPDIKQYLELVSSTIMRNRATAAGNIVNASPIGDMAILLLALDAFVELADGANKREVALKDFFLDYKKMDLREGEIIEWIKFPLPAPGTLINFEKVSRRRYLDIASVNSAISIRVKDNRIEEARLSAGGVSPIPLYLKGTSAFLTGKEVSIENVKQAAALAQKEISPISDVRGSAGYKRLLLRQLLFAHFVKLFPANIPIEELL